MSERHDYTPVALYARVSSDRQDVDLSIAAQLRALRDYANKKGYIVVREYVDEAESGRIADRPEFRKMIDAASKTSRSVPGDSGLEVLPLQPQASPPADAADRPGGHLPASQHLQAKPRA